MRKSVARCVLTRNGRNDPAAKTPALGDPRARRLWLTHFDPSLSDLSAHLDRATAVFPATVLGRDGLTETLSFE